MEACWNALHISDLEVGNRAEVYSMIAAGFHLKSEYVAAVEMLTKAIELDPNEPDHWDDRGYNLLKQKKYQEAIHDFDRALELSSIFFTSYIYRGRALLGLGKVDKAREDFEFAAKFKRPHFATYALYEKGRFHLLIGEYEAAVSDFTASLKNDPSNIESHFRLAVAYSHLGNPFFNLQKAKFHAERAQELSQYPSYYGILAYVLAALGEREQASNFFKKSISTGGPSIVQFYTDRLSSAGLLYKDDGEPDTGQLLKSLMRCAQQRCDLFLPSLPSSDKT